MVIYTYFNIWKEEDSPSGLSITDIDFYTYVSPNFQFTVSATLIMWSPLFVFEFSVSLCGVKYFLCITFLFFIYFIFSL